MDSLGKGLAVAGIWIAAAIVGTDLAMTMAVMGTLGLCVLF